MKVSRLLYLRIAANIRRPATVSSVLELAGYFRIGIS